MRVGLSIRVAVCACLGLGGCTGGGDDASSPAVKLAPVASARDASTGVDATASGDADGNDAADAESEVAEEELPKTLALLRFANWSVGAPAVDFCIAPHGTGTFMTPLLSTTAATLQDAGVDAGTAGLSFPLSSAYLVVNPAQYDVRLVAGGSLDCSAMVTSDATTLPALASGAAGTIALVGAAQPRAGEPGLQILGFLDDLKTNLPTAFLLRAINAAPDLPKVSLGSFSGGSFQTSIVGVPFGSSSVGIPNVGRSSPDSNGYVPVAPLADTVVAASLPIPMLIDGAVASIVAETSPMTVDVGSIVTLAVVGATGQSPVQIVACVDNGGTSGLVGNCQVVSP